MAVWFDPTQAGIANALQNSGYHLVRWPGGSDSDAYHWQTNSLCAGGYANPNATFDNFESDVVKPAALDVAITVNYGSNAACNAGGDPAEAAAWVDYANNTKHYGVKHWTIGNEVYGSWEYDLHSPAHDPTTYANAVATGYYPQMKAKDPTIQVGVVVEGSTSWDNTVLADAKYDFVELHWYAQAPGGESDSYLLDQAPLDLASAVANERSIMNAAGVPSTVPIYVGEMNSVYTNPGKQTVSIVNGLFAGQAVAELLSAGVPMATWWLAFGGCGVGNQSASLYGWQNFGGYMALSDGTPEYGCSSAQSTAFKTPFPPSRAYELLAQFAIAGNHMLPATVAASLPSVRAFAATKASGYTVLLFNLDQSNAARVTIALQGVTRSSFTGSSNVYGKAQYDDSKNGMWTAPVSSSLGSTGKTFTVTLPAWSMTVLTLQ